MRESAPGYFSLRSRASSRIRFAFLACLVSGQLVYASGAADEQKLTPAQAASLICASKAFTEPRRVEIVAGGRMPLNITRDHYLVFRDLGLIRMSIEGRVTEVHLTEKGKLAARGWTRSYVGSYGGSDLWHVPVASRTLLQIEAVAQRNPKRSPPLRG